MRLSLATLDMILTSVLLKIESRCALAITGIHFRAVDPEAAVVNNTSGAPVGPGRRLHRARQWWIYHLERETMLYQMQ